MQEYIPRKLEYQTKDEKNNDQTVTIEDSKLLEMAMEQPIVILADSGMGKTLLIENLAKSSQIPTRHLTASDLVRKSIERLKIQPDEILLIDAFDELPSSKDESGINDVLNKLAELDYPNFILTCRSIEWNESNKNEVTSDYKRIQTVNLLKFSVEDSSKFLVSRGLTSEKTLKLINQLDANNLSSFYENPRNLALISEIDFTKSSIPKTKAKLFELATEKLWQEVNPKAQNLLKEMHQDKILDCAGLIFATYLLTGKQNIYSGSTGTTPDGAVNIYSLISLMDIESLRATVKSRLFQAVDDDLTKPWHRSIAEYLGAKWLADKMSDPMIRRHIFAYLIVDNGVVASLRGLFAWLPSFNPSLSETVIKTDPFGVIEYGDTSCFSDNDSDLLFDALSELAVKNPTFRKRNYFSKTKADGLVKRSLLSKYRDLLDDKQSNVHFLITVLEVLRDADFIDEIQGDLFAIAYDDDRCYSARFNSFILLHNKNLINHSADFQPLINQASEDSLRLVFEYAKRYGYDLLTDEQIVDSVINSFPFGKDERMFTRMIPVTGSHYYFEDFPVNRCLSLVSSLRQSILKLNIGEFDFNYQTLKEINSIILLLLKKAMEAGIAISALSFYEYISIFYQFTTNFYSYEKEGLFAYFQNYFNQHPEFKLEVLKCYIYKSRRYSYLYLLNNTILSSLAPNSDDLLNLLIDVQSQPSNDVNIESWRAILNHCRGKEGIPTTTYEIALPYATENNLTIYLKEQLARRHDPYFRQMKIDKRRIDIERRISYREIRKKLYHHQAELEKGKAKYCNHPAQILLNEYYDIPDNLKAVDKLNYVFNESLTKSALKGFEASLHITVPNISQLLHSSYPIEPVLIAGLYCRLLRGENLKDLSDDVILACSVILDFKSSYGCLVYDANQPSLYLSEVVKKEVIERGLKKKIINEIFIPQFKTDGVYIDGLHWIYGESVDRHSIDTIVYLLNTYPKMHHETKDRLIDILVNNDKLVEISQLIISKVVSITDDLNDFRNESRWYALLSLLDEKLFFKQIYCVTQPKLIFWQLNETYRETRFTKNPKISISLASWIAYRFSHLFNNVGRPSGVSSGVRNPWDASEFIIHCLYEIAKITTLDAQKELNQLRRCIHPSYQNLVTSLIAEQAEKIRETNYQAPSIKELLNIFQKKAPKNCKDIKVIVLTLLEQIQNEVKSSELDTYKMFYEDGKSKTPKTPHNENYCRDRLVNLLKPYIEPYQLRLDTEKDMPDDKRADLVCSSSSMQLPIEVKGQWHDDLWTAMNAQLGELYLKEYQSQGQGIYLIFYFGNCDSKKQLKPHKKYKPQNAKELKDCLTKCIDNQYKNSIDIFVMDLSL